jgi:hypothetical protein
VGVSKQGKKGLTAEVYYRGTSADYAKGESLPLGHTLKLISFNSITLEDTEGGTLILPLTSVKDAQLEKLHFQSDAEFNRNFGLDGR